MDAPKLVVRSIPGLMLLAVVLFCCGQFLPALFCALGSVAVMILVVMLYKDKGPTDGKSQTATIRRDRD